MGSSGNNSTPSFYGRLLNEVLGLKLKIIVGYESQTHAFLAMERNEINGYPSVFYNSLVATKPTWLPEKKVKLLVQMGLEKEKDIADVPFLPDLITKEDDKLLGPGGDCATVGRPSLSDAAGRSRRPGRRHAQGLYRYLQGSGIPCRSREAQAWCQRAARRTGAAGCDRAGLQGHARRRRSSGCESCRRANSKNKRRN